MQSLIDLEFFIASTPAEGRRAVLDNLRAGADVIKVVADDDARAIDEDTLKAIVNEAHRSGVRVAVHATSTRGIGAAVGAEADSIEHADEATDDQLRAMREKNMTLVPTVWPRDLLPIPRTYLSLPNVNTLIDQYVAGERSKIARARTAGVKIAFGSDNWFAVPGKTRDQVTRAVLEALNTSFALTPAEVLKAATVNAAELLNVSALSGTIEAGSLADLIAVDGDPLANIGDLEKITFVMKNGTIVRK